MDNKLSIIEVLDEFGACDIDTLALYLEKSAHVVIAMMTNLMRKKQVKLVDGLYQLVSVDENKEDENAEIKAKSKDKLTPTVAPAPEVAPITITSTSTVTDNVTNEGKGNEVQNQPKLKPNPNKRTAKYLRNLLQQSGRAMSTTELAQATGFPTNYIGSMLKHCVKRGDVIYELKQGEIRSGKTTYLATRGLRFYQWVGEKHEKQPTPPPQQDVNASVGDNADANDCTYIYLSKETKSEPELMPEKVPTLPPNTGLINIPNSTSLQDKLTHINARIEELTKVQQRTTEMLNLVVKLEELIIEGDSYSEYELEHENKACSTLSSKR